MRTTSERSETALELLEPFARVGNAEREADWVHINVEPRFTCVDTDVNSGLRVWFGRDLALHTGLAPHHLFRPSAKDGRTKLSHGSSQGLDGPARPIRGGRPPSPDQPASFADSGRNDHARVRVRGSPKGKALREGPSRRAQNPGESEAVERSEPLAAPHPNPLPVALGVIVARSRSWMARGRRGEGVPAAPAPHPGTRAMAATSMRNSGFTRRSMMSSVLGGYLPAG